MICIAGADGFFGAYLQEELLKREEAFMALNHRFCLHGDDKKVINLPFEITDKNCLYAVKEKLQAYENIKIIYLIAAHNPDFIKENPLLSSRINGTYYRDFLDILPEKADIKLYYISSDTVYGESVDGRIFTEKDERNPVNLYGEQKCKAEDITLSCGFSALRCSYMFGPSGTGKPHFFDNITENLKQGKPIEMFTDYRRNALSYRTAARLLINLLEKENVPPILNLCADKMTSKYDIGLFAAKKAGVSPSLCLPVKSTDRKVFSERRAGTLCMSNGLLKDTLGFSSPIDGFTL